jgi:ATP-binding cassette subfamily B protein
MQRYQDSFRFIDFAARLNGFAVFLVGGLYTAYLYQNNQLSVAVTVVIIAYLSQMTGRIMGMIFAFRDVIKNLPTIEDFYDLYDAKSSILPPLDPQTIKDPKGKVDFANVSFGYNIHQPVLQNLSLGIKPNETVALVGVSGGGKSTVTRLLMRYYDVDEGEITIDGVNVQSLSNDSIRNLIGLVPQEPVLFNRTIFYNVGYALDDIGNLDNVRNRKIVEDACKKAYIHDFIVSLKDGYDTVVGERGLKLSGGQKQRIAIARVLIKNPKIVIFDEATSMLDSESEKSIQLAFAELSKNKTVIIIAHRLSTITHCDNIFVIDAGKVVEKGKHAQLLTHSTIYKKLWSIQSGGFARTKQQLSNVA